MSGMNPPKPHMPRMPKGMPRMPKGMPHMPRMPLGNSPTDHIAPPALHEPRPKLPKI